MKRILIKITAFTLIFSFVFGFSACKSNSEEKTTAVSTSAVQVTAEKTTAAPISDDTVRGILESAGKDDWDGNYKNLTPDQKNAIEENYNAKGEKIEIKADGVYSKEDVTEKTTDSVTTTVTGTTAKGQITTGTTKPIVTTKPVVTSAPVSTTKTNTTEKIIITTKPVTTAKPATTEATTEPYTNDNYVPVTTPVSTKTVVENILKSTKYTMQYEMLIDDVSGEVMKITAYVSGNKAAFKTYMEVEDEKVTVIMLSNGTGFYAIFPSLGGYVKLPDDEFNDMLPGITTNTFADAEYLGASKASYKGVEYDCETYKKEGVTKKYFLKDFKLKRIEITDADGTASSMENVNFSFTVDESILKLPAGYMNMTLLLSGLF